MEKQQADLLGTSFACSCGRNHVVPTQDFYYTTHAFDHLAETVAKLSGIDTILVVADTRTYAAAGRAVVAKLLSHGFTASRFIVEDIEGESPVADDATRDHIQKTAPPADLYIAVGSGVINDLVKWVSFLQKKPYLTMATAASMNGYASANVAASIGGLKVLFHADAPLAVFADPNIIINAPFELTTSGLGDVLAKTVSSADWKLNQFLFQEYYCRFSVDLLKDLEPVYLENPLKIKAKDGDAVRALFEALFFSSIAMTITGTSSPASGGEHLISHTLDMLAVRDGGKHDLHGRQVGVASILMAALYEKVMLVEVPVFKEVPQVINDDFWGALAPVVAQEYAKKLPRYKEAAAFLSQPGKWQDLKDLIQLGLVPARKLKKCLADAGGAHRYGDIRFNRTPLTKGVFIDIVRHAHQMRQRFTILDLAIMLGINPQHIGLLVEEWIEI